MGRCLTAQPDIPFPALSWLAPMSGATDAAFRKQAARFGAKAVVSEMVAGESLAAARPDVVRRTCRHDGGGPWIVQLAARRPEDMRLGAVLVREAGVDMIDINMGCPSKQVTGGQSGSALMRDLDLAESIIDAALEGAADVPVSLKMRLGWDQDQLNAPELAKLAEFKGICWITVHGRTRCMFYKGRADWAAIGETVRAVAIPVIANGDICDLSSARNALDVSNAKAVMIGRAAMGRPWLIGEIEAGLSGVSYQVPSLREQCESLCEQVSDSADLYGERLGVKIVRKHVSAAIDGAELNLQPDERRRLRSSLCQITGAADLIASIRSAYSPLAETLAA